MNRFLFALFVILGLATFASYTATGQTVPPGPTIPPGQSPFLAVVGGCQTIRYYGGVTGEIINRSFTQAYSVTLEAQVEHESGEIETRIFMPTFPATLPEQPNPFCLDWDTRFDDLVSLRIRDVAVIDATPYAHVTVIPQHIGCDDRYSGAVGGILRNDNAFPVYAIRFSLWNRSNYTRGFRYATLPPGAEQPFATDSTEGLCWYGTPEVTPDTFRSAGQGLRVSGDWGGSDVWLPLIGR